jgi:hypothetical protein
MEKLLATILIAGMQQLYQAQTATYGCNSGENVAALEKIRPTDEQTFRAQLSERVLQGDCVLFMKGAVVEGSDPDTNASLLHVQSSLDPPGYSAPLADFKLQVQKQESPGAGDGPRP